MIVSAVAVPTGEPFPPKPSAMQLAELSNLTKIHSTAIILAPYAPLSLKSSSMLKA